MNVDLGICWAIDRNGSGWVELGHNEITTAGLQNALNLIFGLGGTALSHANARVGVGDSSSGFVANQTDLQAATNKLRKSVDLGSPSRTAQTVTLQAAFDPGEATFHWREYGLFWGASTSMLSRRVQDLGTKTLADTWTLQATVSLLAA